MALIRIRKIDRVGKPAQLKAIVQRDPGDDLRDEDLQGLAKFCRDDEQLVLVIDGKHEVVWS